MNHMAAGVIITQEGRSGAVIYQFEGRSIKGWWEFAGGDAIAIVSMGSVGQWEADHPWAGMRRAEIMRFVADEVIRQKATGCKAEIDEEGGWINIVRR